MLRMGRTYAHFVKKTNMIKKMQKTSSHPSHHKRVLQILVLKNKMHIMSKEYTHDKKSFTFSSKNNQ